MNIKNFIKKVKELGYHAEHRTVDGFFDEIIINEDNHYFVSVYPPIVYDAPFEYIMKHVKCEVQELKTKVKKGD